MCLPYKLSIKPNWNMNIFQTYRLSFNYNNVRPELNQYPYLIRPIPCFIEV
jgi:hypothetical protein